MMRIIRALAISTVLALGAASPAIAGGPAPQAGCSAHIVHFFIAQGDFGGLVSYLAKFLHPFGQVASMEARWTPEQCPYD